MTNFNSVPPSYIIWQVTVLTVNTFTISCDPSVRPPIVPTGTYVGNGTITRLYIPRIQSKQFPTAWGMGRKTRIGVQQYLFTATANAQITLLIYLSQNASTAWNASPYVPEPNSENNSVVYSDIIYTCRENTNLGLTPANINLQQIVPAQSQIWHRMNTSLIGDTVQVEFTLNSEQMFDNTLTNQIAEIELQGMIIDVYPSQGTLMSMRVVNSVPYLRTTRDFPEDGQALRMELNKSYIDTSNAINVRTIGIFPTNLPAITGEEWFLSGIKQQSLRQVYTFSSFSSPQSIAHNLNLSQISMFTKIYGTATDGSIWYTLPYVDITDVTNQISLTITSSNIVITAGGGSPPAITSGSVILEWLSQI